MKEILHIHQKLFRSLSAQEVIRDRKKEFNSLISDYEFKPSEIVDYLIIVTDTFKQRKKLIHKILNNYEQAEAILALAELTIKYNNERKNS